MVQNWLLLANAFDGAVLLPCFVACLAAANARPRGRARVLGVLGLVLLALSTLLIGISGSLGPWLTITYGSGVDFAGLISIAVGSFGAVGLVLLALAIAAAQKTTSTSGGQR